MDDERTFYEMFTDYAIVFGFYPVPKHQWFVEGYCVAPHDAPDGTFLFVFECQAVDRPFAFWKGPRRHTPVDLHEGIRALAFARATPQLPQDPRRIADLCFGGAQGNPSSLKELMALGLKTAEYESWQRELTPSAGMLDLYGIPHNLPKSRPLRKR